MFADFDFGVIERSWQYLFATGMVFTLQLTLYAMVGGIIVGTLLALARLSSFKPLALVAAGYVNLIRALPLILVIFWFYFLAPYVFQWVVGADQPVKVGALTSCLVTFIMFEAGYYCEIMRAGIQSIPRGQVNAGYALGMNYWQLMSFVVLPQAFRNMMPLLLTQTIILFQDVSLVYVLSMPDFLGSATKIARRDGRLVEMYLFVAVVYFVVAYTLSTMVRKLQHRMALAR